MSNSVTTSPHSTPSSGGKASVVLGEFKATGHVVLLGTLCFACLLTTGKAFSTKILADMQGATADTSTLMLMAVVFGFLAEVAGAAYLFRRRKYGTRRKAGALLVVSVMLMMLVPIQFAVLSLWLAWSAIPSVV